MNNAQQSFIIRLIICMFIMIISLPPFVRWLDSIDPAPLGVECICCKR